MTDTQEPQGHSLKTEIRRTLAALFPENALVEVRMFGALRNQKSVVAGYYTDHDRLASDVARAEEKPGAGRFKPKNVYMTLNRLNPALVARSQNRLSEYAELTTADDNITHRTLLLVDCDPTRPAGISSTLAELRAAQRVAHNILTFLSERGWPDPAVADSGNGSHLLYRLDLPNDETTTLTLQNVLLALAHQFDTAQVSVDTKVFNAGRITKLYGTWARKGDDTDGRPHRQSRLRRVPETFVPVLLTQLQEIAKEAPVPVQPARPQANRTNGHSAPSGPFDMEDFIRRHSLATDAPKPYKGGQKWAMGCLFNASHKSPDAALYVTQAGAAAFRCSHNSCRGNDWTALRETLEPGSREKREQGQSRYQKRKELEQKRETVGERVRDMDGLPVIETANRHLREVVNDTLAALIKANDPPVVFVRGTSMVRIVRDEHDVPTIVQWAIDSFRFRLSNVANFVSTSDDRGTVAVLPPAAVVTAIMTLDSFGFLPRLETVVTSPIVACDGTLITEPGYIEEAGVYYHEPDSRLAKGIGDTEPTEANVSFAKSLLLDTVLGDFPYADKASKAHALSALLQPFVRPCIMGNTQMYVIKAPTQGTGKSLLAETIAGVFMGHVPSSTPCPDRHNDDEWRKLITTALMEGPTHVWFDNLKHRLDSAQLAQALTSQSWKDRLLGGNQSVTVPTRCTWILTGNNVEMDGDFPRRCAAINLDARIDRPEDRDPNAFAVSDLQSYVLDERPTLIRAVVILLRVWLKARRPMWTGKPIGSYTSWCRVMGGLLESIGVDGFLSNREDLYEKSDPERERWYAFVSAWREKHGDEPVGVAALVETAVECEIIDDESRGSKNHLGRKLLGRENQTFKGFAIVRAKAKQRAMQYRLQSVKGGTETMDFTAPPAQKVNQVNQSESKSPDTRESPKTSTRVQPEIHSLDSLDSLSTPVDQKEREVEKGKEGDEDPFAPLPADPDADDGAGLEDPFAEDALDLPYTLTYADVQLGGETLRQATLTYPGAGGTWTETGTDPTDRAALQDMLQNVEDQPDDETARAEKRNLIQMLLAQ